MTVRVRFAPSPTGQVHIGNIRTAIFNWLYVRHEGGKFLLRVEDTDRERSTPEALKTVIDALDWLGLDRDEEAMFQSARCDAHLEAAETLLSKGLAYKEDKGKTGKGECIIFRMPGDDMTYHDEVKGDLKKEGKDLKDFVIVRSDGSPVFHLANVIDDIEMNITLIMRGDDHVENTFRHIALYRALGAEIPQYAHLPMIVNAQGKPYSKRDGAAFIGEFRENGYMADALFNYLALLGWSPGGDRELLSRQEMIELFTLDRVRSASSQMDVKKLGFLNGLHLAEQPLNKFMEQVCEANDALEWMNQADPGMFRKVCELLQSRTKTYNQAAEWKYFFVDDIDYAEKAVRKVLKKEDRSGALELLASRMAQLDFSAENIEHAIRATEKEVELGEGKLNQPTRVAITGLATGAGVYETAALLGKERVVARLLYAARELCV